jgi:hypothetical protein
MLVHHCRRKEDPTIERGTNRQGHACALVASKDLVRALDAAKEVTRGASAPSAKMAGRPWFVGIQPFPPPIMRGSHHQHAKVPIMPEATERAWFILFPLVQ